MQDRLVAEIPALPAAWRITFDLKLTKESKACCRICNNGILTVAGGDEWEKSELPRISYRCASQTNEASIVISHQLEKFFLTHKGKELILGEWSSFDISQEILEFNQKKRLMFMVNTIEFICKVLMCTHMS